MKDREGKTKVNVIMVKFETQYNIRVYKCKGYGSAVTTSDPKNLDLDGKLSVCTKYSDPHKVSSRMIRDWLSNESPSIQQRAKHFLHKKVLEFILSLKIYSSQPNVVWPVILIVGGPKSGKTTIGKALSDKLGYELVSGDAILADVRVNNDAELEGIEQEFMNHYERAFRWYSDWLLKIKLRQICPTGRDTRKFKGTIIEGAGFAAKTIEVLETVLRKISMVILLRCPSLELTRRLEDEHKELPQELKKNFLKTIFGYEARCEFWVKIGLRFWILVGYVDFSAKFGAKLSFRV